MVQRSELVHLCNQLLQPQLFKDYCPNGLQVEGRSEVKKIVSGVTASRALIEAAIAEGADTLLVHHGLFWRGQDGSVSGWMKQRLALLLAHDINLLAYHLPLDAHEQWGNNAQLGLQMGWETLDRFGDQRLGWLGAPINGVTDPASMQTALEHKLGRVPVAVIPDATRSIKRIARAVLNPGLKLRLPQVRMRLSPVKYPNLRRIWRKKPVWLFLPVVTMPPSVMEHPHWLRMWHLNWAWRINS